MIWGHPMMSTIHYMHMIVRVLTDSDPSSSVAANGVLVSITNFSWFDSAVF